MRHYGALQFGLIMNQFVTVSNMFITYPIRTVLRANPAQPTDGGTTMRVHVLLAVLASFIWQQPLIRQPQGAIQFIATC